MKKIVFGCLFFLFNSFCILIHAQPLPVEKAFNFSAQLASNNNIKLQWQIAPGNYLYQEHFDFKVLSPNTAKIGSVQFPPAQQKQDDVLGDIKIYKKNLVLNVPILNATDAVTLQVTYQGCSEQEYCYPPVTHTVTAHFTEQTIAIDAQPTQTATPTTTTTTTDNAKNKFDRVLSGHHFIIIFISFIGFGLLLAFTPCVLPMVPILSGIILGHGHHISTGKAFRLSLVYVLSMSITYAIAGMLIGYLGGELQLFFQKPWVIALFSVIFVLLALSMFGLYNLQPPQKFEAFLARISRHQKKGSYIGVAIMGCLGTLIISPCVTPALVAALGYITQKGDIWIGGAALFATGIGMGIPLLLIGTSTKLLPKTGHWMVTVKSFVGVLLLAMAIFMLSRILAGPVVLFLWAILLIGSAIYLGALTNGNKSGWGKLARAIGIIALIYGIILIVAAATGHSNPLRPFHKKTELATPAIAIHSVTDLKHALALAKSHEQPVALDFYADWCISCKEMDRNTFSNEEVQQQLSKFMFLRADVTKNNDNDRSLMKAYNVIGPPTIIFFNPQGQELQNFRVVGAMDAETFLQRLNAAYQGAFVRTGG